MEGAAGAVDARGQSMRVADGAGRFGRPADGRSLGFTSREIALLGLMAALWGAIEITVGGMIKSWHVPFGGSLLSTFGVVVLLTARAGVPRRWSSVLVGLVAGGIRFASGFGGAVFAALGIAAEAVIVEVVLDVMPSRPRARVLAGALAVLWALVHPFVVQGYLAGLGPEKVYEFTVGLIAGGGPHGSGEILLVFAFLIIVHVALGVSAVMFVDRILLGPYARSSKANAPGSADGGPTSSGRGPNAAAIALVLAAVAFSTQQAAAQQTEASRIEAEGGPPATYVLPEFTVFGTRLFGPYAVFQLDADDVQDVGAEDLAQALEMVPGIVVRTDWRGEARLSTRGLAEREIVVLVDGVPISDPYTGSVSSSMVLAGALGTVRVTKGPAASVYGANALGGIVEVCTVGRGHSGLRFEVSKGSDGRYSGHVSGGGRIGCVAVAGGVAANGRSDFTLPASFDAEQWEDGGKREYSAREELFAWGRAEWSVGARTDASVSVQVADGRRDVPASTNSDRPRFWRFPLWREVRTVGSVGFRPNDQLLFEGRLYYATNDNQLAAYNDFERTDRRWLSSVSNRAIGGYAYGEYRGVPGQRISGGVNVRGDIARLQRDAGEAWRRYEATTASVFGQDVVRLAERDRVSFALNADMMAGEGRFLATLNPQAAWTHGLSDGLSVRVLAGMKTRFPTLKEWFSVEIGNPDLRPERSVAVELELAKVTSAGSRLSLVGFRQSVSDMIVTAGWGDPARNLGSVGSWGAELGVRHRLSPGVDLDLTLAMTSARDTESNTDVPFVPKTMGAVVASYERGPVRCIARATRVGSRRDARGTTLPPYVLVDARVAVTTRIGDVFVGAENLLDVLYEDEDGFPQPGRCFEIGVSRDLYR